MKQHNYLTVGSGLFGPTFAFFVRRKGRMHLLTGRRPHPGGNVYCENVEGINVQGNAVVTCTEAEGDM